MIATRDLLGYREPQTPPCPGSKVAVTIAPVDESQPSPLAYGPITCGHCERGFIVRTIPATTLDGASVLARVVPRHRRAEP